MPTLLYLLCVAAFCAAIFVTGVHNASNAIAVPVRTRAMTPVAALVVSALFNGAGVILAYMLIKEYEASWLVVPGGAPTLLGIVCALTTTAAWGTITWAMRMPSSATHALIGALAGVAWYAHTDGFENYGFVHTIFTTALAPLLLLPPLTFLLSWVLVFPFYRLALRTAPHRVNSTSREVLAVSTAGISLLHGLQVGQRYLLLLLLSGVLAPFTSAVSFDKAPATLMIVCAALVAAILAAGTLTGGWRIGYTFTHRMVRLDPLRGAIAQGTTAAVLAAGQFVLQLPFSSSHLAVASALGAGVNQRHASVSARVVRQILLTWVITFPACFLLAVALMSVTGLFFE